MKKIINKLKIMINNLKPWQLLILFFIPILLLEKKRWFMDNIDIWYIFNDGRYFLAHGFPHTDPFTVHEGLHFVASQWLYSICIWLIFKYLKVKGLFIFFCIETIIFTYLTYYLCKTISNNKKVSILITILIDSLEIYFGFITMRPQMITYICLIFFFIVIEKYMKDGKGKRLLWLMPTSILQIDSHAAMWWFSFIYSVPFVVELLYKQIIEKDKKCDARKLIIFLVIAFFAGFINPYGIDAMTYLGNSFHPKVSSTIAEMLPTSFFSKSGIAILVILMLNVIVYIKSARKEKIKISYFLMLFGSLIIAINTKKCQFFLFYTAIYPLAYYFKNYLTYKITSKTTRNFKIRYAILIIIFTGIVIFYGTKTITFSTKVMNHEAIDYLSDFNEKENATLFIDYNFGSYALYKGFKPYIYSRAEQFYVTMNKKEDIFSEMLQIEKKSKNANDFFDKYKFDYIIINDESTFCDYDEFDNYELIKKLDNSRIYQRND